ncbi:hypothetical protein AAH029_17205 [Parabacteroides distasonis]|uniref:hypothetical protein n=1 Tax=Parabacteroides distasonis TaxID=823 RepID=UPI0039B58D04
MNARDYICRNYLKLAMLAKEAVSENRIFLVKGDQLLQQVIDLMDRDYKGEKPDVAFDEAMSRLVNHYQNIEKGI